MLETHPNRAPHRRLVVGVGLVIVSGRALEENDSCTSRLSALPDLKGEARENKDEGAVAVLRGFETEHFQRLV